MGTSVVTLFMVISLLGRAFSDLSLEFKSKFEVLAGVAYSPVVVSARSAGTAMASDGSNRQVLHASS